jgi:hypothetical protein
MATIDEMADEIASLAAHLDAATHRLLTCIRSFDEADGWHQQGALSCAHWLSWRLGLDPVTAREKTRVARALGQLPRIDEALRQGTLSYAKVRALTRVATPETEEKLLDVALEATAAQLERICRGYRQATAAESDKARDEERRLTERLLPNGMVRLEVVLHPDEAALVLKAVERAHAEAQAHITPEEPAASAESAVRNDTSASMKAAPHQAASTARKAPPFPGRVDGLVAVAESFLAHGQASGNGGERFQVFMHVGQDPLAPDGEWTATMDDGTRVSAEALRRISCDAAVVGATVTPGGDVLDLGRRTRTIPPALRRALWLRDRGCRYPGCSNRIYLHGHHIRHWVHGGETSLRNTILLCSFHHRLVHEGGFTVKVVGEQVVFRNPRGRELPNLFEAMPVPDDAVKAFEKWARSEGLEIGADTYHLAWDGTNPDYGHIVATLMT